ncbi:MAG TPA: hypothetical protein PKU70_03735 [Vicinamibacteria bacterium]|nr:hypothetical protein [Vicinamibacteria bacterium]
MRGWLRGAGIIPLLALLLGPGPVAIADDYELGLENYLYRSTSTPLNRGNIFGLEPTENLFRLVGSGRKAFGNFAFKASAYVERQTGKNDATRTTFRQAFGEYKTESGFLVRLGRQRTAWGSGFVWNPTDRIEPPKSPANPGNERPGIDAARLDVSPTDWASLTLVAGRANVTLTDLPGALAKETDPEWTGAVRARLLVRDTDIALTWLAGTKREGLFGLDLGRTWGAVALHAESAVYRGSEIDRTRGEETFLRVSTGALWSPGDSTLSVEYFFNGEGMDDAQFRAYTNRLGRNLSVANDPNLPAAVRAAAFAAWNLDAAIPFGGNLGLRRHYASISFTRREIAEDLAANLRTVIGLSDRGLIVTPGLAYAPSRNVQMSLDLVLLFGPEDAEYKLAPIERAFQARLKYSF